MIKNYLQIMEESLRKKMDILCRIEDVNMRQEQILKEETVSENDFEQTINDKGVLIDELNQLDDGFENLYEHIKEQLLQGREKYKFQIADLQEWIKKVTDKSVTVQTQEERNRQLVEKYFTDSRKKLQKGRRSSKIALDYYRNMNQTQVMPPQFMDKKK